MNIFSYFKSLIQEAVKQVFFLNVDLDDIGVEYPNNAKYGDICTNIAMILHKKYKLCDHTTSEIAHSLADALMGNGYFKDIQVAAPGFINFSVDISFWHTFLKELIQGDEKRENLGQKEKVNIEYVSANPTGPLHIGHAKSAIFGDVIANLFQYYGYDVTKEYLINDYGNQINILAKSLYIRYLQLLDIKQELQEDCYPGQYLIEIARKVLDKHGNRLTLFDEEERNEILKNFAVDEILKLIKSDLADIGIKHDVFVSEKNLVKTLEVEQAINFLESKGFAYYGSIDKPKMAQEQDWLQEDQLLFKSKDFGDTEDRVLVKANGEYTYFVSDVAYHYDKIRRGFNRMIVFLGHDHIGYEKRLCNAVKALSNGEADITIKFCQLVKLVKDGKQVKMSKREGNFITLKEMIDDVGADALRLSVLKKTIDTSVEIDVDLIKKQSKDNPIFYIQYASARMHSVLRKAKDEMSIDIEKVLSSDISSFIKLITKSEDIELIKLLALFPKMLYSSFKSLDPHKIYYYVYDLAATFHQLWDKGVKDSNLRFVVEQDRELTKARTLLVLSALKILKTNLQILGIKPLEYL